MQPQYDCASQEKCSFPRFTNTLWSRLTNNKIWGDHVSRYDRYVLSQYLLFFGFFALILVAVFWVNRAVILFDKLIGDGQSALVFLEFTALALPNLIRMVLPIAAFTAAVWVTNRLNGESEFTVLRATGSSPWRMARPAFAFGLITAGMMLILTHVLLPTSIRQLEIREADVARNVTARILNEGDFLHPAEDVTFYIRQIDDDGTLNDVFLSDSRDPDVTITYTGTRAFLVRDEDRTHLIMVDGLAQRLEYSSRRLSTTAFADFSYDISSLAKSSENEARNLRAIPSHELLTRRSDIMAEEDYTEGELAEEFHLRFARAFVCIAVTLIGFSALMIGGFSRFGVWRQALMAFVLLILVEGLRGVVADPVVENANLWPLIYLPTAIGLLIATLFLQLSARPIGAILKRRKHAQREVSG